jgi:hypothetical protein
MLEFNYGSPTYRTRPANGRDPPQHSHPYTGIGGAQRCATGSMGALGDDITQLKALTAERRDPPGRANSKHTPLQQFTPTGIRCNCRGVRAPHKWGGRHFHPLGRCLLPDQVGLGARGSSNATMGKWIYAPRKAFKTQNPQNSKTS